MNSPVVFISKRCPLPQGLLLNLSSIDSVWDSTELSGREFTEAIQSHGWYCIWLTEKFSKVSVGRTPALAKSRALKSGLDALSTSFNAAEIASVNVASFGGFSFAKIVIHARHVQHAPGLLQWQTRGKENDGDY
jgi:hypothetical protein